MSKESQDVLLWLLGIAGGWAALWAGAMYLIRKLLGHGLTKDLANHSAKLNADLAIHTAKIRAETDIQIARLNSELKLGEFEHQLRFAKVYDRQGEIIAKLYELISQAEIHLIDAVNGFRFGGQPTQEEQEMKFAEFYNQAHELYRKSRIYIPKNLCDEISKLFSAMRDNHSIYTIYHPFRDGGRRDISDDRFNKWQEAQMFIQKEIPLVRAALEEEFRQLLQGNSGGSF